MEEEQKPSFHHVCHLLLLSFIDVIVMSLIVVSHPELLRVGWHTILINIVTVVVLLFLSLELCCFTYDFLIKPQHLDSQTAKPKPYTLHFGLIQLGNSGS